MKLRSLLLAAFVALSSTLASAQAPVLSSGDTTSLQQAIAAKDAKAIAQLAKNNPAQAEAIARAAAVGAPDQAAVFAAAVAKATGNTAGVAKAVAAAVPAQAATIATAVAKTTNSTVAQAAIVKAVVEAAPTQAATVAVAVLTGAGTPTAVRTLELTKAAVEGIPATDRSSNALVVAAAVTQVVSTGSKGAAIFGAADAAGLNRATLSEAVNNISSNANASAAAGAAASAGRTAGTNGSAAGTTGNAAGSNLSSGTTVVVTPSTNSATEFNTDQGSGTGRP